MPPALRRDRRLRRRAFCALLALAPLLCGAQSGVTAPDLPLDAQEAELQAVEERLSELRTRLTDRERYRDALFAELERNALEVSELLRAERTLEQRIAGGDARIADLIVRLGQTESQLVDARSGLSELLRSAYVAGPGDRLRLLLDHQDMARVGRRLGYYKALARVRAARVREVRRLAAELAALRSAAELESRELKALAEEQRRTRRALEGARVARAAVLADIEGQIETDRDRVTELDANASALRSLVEQLRERAKIADEIEIRQVPITARRGKLPLPVTGARVEQRFRGDARPGRLHADGVVLASASGSEVFPVHHGQVIHADWLRGFGLLLVIDHGDGYMSLYGHNQSLLKEVGEWVGPDDVIALSGSIDGVISGDEPGQLYFALRRHGTPIDPVPWFDRSRG
jgi:septal ring factor EnvC (AmiA/AmiB activator)